MAIVHEEDRKWFRDKVIPEEAIRNLFSRKYANHIVQKIEEHSDLGEFHKIFFVSFNSGPDVVLRVARPCFPPFKIENEVAILTYLAQHTNIAVPKVFFWSNDAKSSDNDIGFEYMAMERIRGKTLLREWRTLAPEVFDKLMDQIVNQWISLREIQFDGAVGGLCFKRNNDGSLDESTIVPGRVVEETMWTYPDIQRYWGMSPTAESFDKLNISGPFPSYIAFLQAHLRQYCHNIGLHPKMEYARHYIPRVEALLKSLDDKSDPWAKRAQEVRCYLAHRDTHLGNMIFEGDQILAFIDWEFANLVPSWTSNPSWNMPHEPPLHPPVDPSKIVETRSLREIWPPKFKSVLERIAPEVLAENELECPAELVLVEQVRTYLRCILEVVPRDDKEKVPYCVGGEWDRKIDEGLKGLGF